MKTNKYCILMSGGKGSRFWPLSTRSAPKQFIDIFGTGKSLLRQTYERYRKVFDDDKIFIVTNERYVSLTQQQIPELAESHILKEPMVKDTSVCIAYAYNRIKAFDPNAQIMISPTDHVIFPDEKFYQAIEDCFEFVDSKNLLLSIGLKPHKAHSGYGYIQYRSDQVQENIKEVKTFVEKPNEEMAQLFVDSGEFMWNTGIMFANINSLDQAYKEHQPVTYNYFQSNANVFNTYDEYLCLLEIYPQLEKLSIDYAIMEKASNSYVYIADFDWTDMGSWSALHEISEKDEHNNFVANHKTILYDTENCVINSLNHKHVVIEGLKDYIVADSGNSLLIMPKKNEAKIKSIVNRLKIENAKKND